MYVKTVGEPILGLSYKRYLTSGIKATLIDLAHAFIIPYIWYLGIGRRRTMTAVFISYVREDFEAAKRLQKDLKDAGLNPWLDRTCLIAGENWKISVKNAIKKSRYFIPLFSSVSVEKRGYVQKEFKYAIEVFDEFPESQIYVIPCRLDDCEIPIDKLEDIEYVDLFPNWEEGMRRILQAMKAPTGADNGEHTTTGVSPIEAPNQNTKSMQKQVLLSSLFKGEKEFFVGRKVYLNKIIKKAIKPPGSRVSIVGPGGSGKSQLAFKAIHQYQKEGIFDAVIPIYFDSGLRGYVVIQKPLSELLSNMAEYISIPVNEFDKYANIEDRKTIVRNALSGKSHPLIFVDNYETVSYELNDKSKQPSQNAVDISNFLNENVPNNVSILLTSREKYNNLREELIDLEGLSESESKDLFNGLVVADRLLRNPKNEKVKEQIRNLLEKTGGHPLSIELIAKNITSVEELEELSKSLETSHGLGTAQVDRTASEERFKSLDSCFGYTLNKLDNPLKELLPKLTIFKSPFPISAAVEILGIQKSDIINLYNRSLLTRIESENLDYLLYYIHPALRSYMQAKSDKKLETEYGQAFSGYYLNLLSDTIKEWGKENHLPSMTRFNIIAESEYSDFDRAIELSKNRNASAHISTLLGIILYKIGILSKSLEYNRRSLKIHDELNDRGGMAKDYSRIGEVLGKLDNYQEALGNFNKALKIYEELNDRVGMAKDYYNISFVLSKTSKDEALNSLYNALTILQVFERENNYRHPFMEKVNNRISYLKR